MQKEAVSTSSAPAALGPYSQGIRAGSMLFISGQVAINPATGKLIDGPIADQTRQILANIGSICEAGGSRLENIVKTTIFLTNLGDFQEVNQAYGAYFKNSPPARSTIQVAALPLGACIEIEAVALID